MSIGQIIDYFRNELRNKLLRPACQKHLTLWDHDCWIKSNHVHAHFTINANDFLQFWYRTCYELCCVNDIRAFCLKNALDKYFYLMLDFENYFIIFIQRKIFKSRPEILQAVTNYNLDTNSLKSKVRRNKTIEHLFKEFVNKVNEWNYWKKIIIIQFIRINIGEGAFQSAQKNSIQNLCTLVQTTEKVWDRGVSGNNSQEDANNSDLVLLGINNGN